MPEEPNENAAASVSPELAEKYFGVVTAQINTLRTHAALSDDKEILNRLNDPAELSELYKKALAKIEELRNDPKALEELAQIAIDGTEKTAAAVKKIADGLPNGVYNGIEIIHGSDKEPAATPAPEAPAPSVAANAPVPEVAAKDQESPAANKAALPSVSATNEEQKLVEMLERGEIGGIAEGKNGEKIAVLKVAEAPQLATSNPSAQEKPGKGATPPPIPRENSAKESRGGNQTPPTPREKFARDLEKETGPSTGNYIAEAANMVAKTGKEFLSYLKETYKSVMKAVAKFEPRDLAILDGAQQTFMKSDIQYIGSPSRGDLSTFSPTVSLGKGKDIEIKR